MTKISSTPYNAARPSHRSDAIGTTDTRNQTRTVAQPGPRASSGPLVALTDNGDPIRWISSQEVNGRGPYRGNNLRRSALGIERLPSLGHQGDYRVREVDERTRGRYSMVLRADGNTVAHCHTNGAAHVTAIEHERFSRDDYCQLMLTKRYALGWVDIDAGCLLGQVARGIVDPRKLIVPLDGNTCEGECSHIAAETEARRARQRSKMDKLEAASAANDPATKIAEGVARALREADKPKRGK